MPPDHERHDTGLEGRPADEDGESEGGRRLTPEEKEVIAARLGEKIEGEVSCPICGKDTWGIGDLEGRIQGAGNLMGGPGYPVVTAICTNCGFHAFFNTLVLGFGKSSPPEEDRDDG